MKYNFEQQSGVLQEFLDRLSIERNLSENTLYAYRCDIRSFIRWMEEMEYKEMNEASMLRYFAYLQDEMRLAARSIKRKYVAIQQYCRHLSRHYCPEEQFFRFSSRRFQVPHHLPRTLSMKEIEELIMAASETCREANTEYQYRLSIRNVCIIELLFCLGLRIGEVAALDIRDYDRCEQSVLVRGKGNKERLLFISSKTVCKKLEEWIIVRRDMKPLDSALFISKLGRRLSVYSIENIFYKYRELAQINPQSTPHYLRHSFATQLLNNGAGIRDVQELLGHTSIATTQIYTEVSLQRKRDVLEKYNARNYMNVF